MVESPELGAQQARSDRVEATQAAGLIAVGSISSRLLGVLREVVKAGLFGATGSVGALEVAIRVPTIIYELLVGGMINSALVPVLSDYSGPEHRRELWRLLSALLCVAVVALSAFVLLAEALAPEIVWLMAGGLKPELQSEAVSLLRIMLPAVLFLNMAGIATGALYALKRFVYPAFTAAVFNAATVAAALVLGRRMGVASVAVGVLAGAVLQLAVQWPGLRDARLRLPGKPDTLNLSHAALHRIGRLYIPIAMGLIVDMLGVGLSYNLASRTGEQSIPWMQYSATLIQLPLGLVSIAVSIAILPTLSRQVTRDEPHAFRATLAYGLRMILALTMPATIGLWVMAAPLVALVFEHGPFGPADTIATVAALRFHLVGLIFAAVDQPLIFAFYARKDTWTPALVGVVTVVLYVLMALVPTLFVPLTLNRLILANSLKWAAHALIMLTLLHRQLRGFGAHRIWSLMLRSGAAAAAMGGVVHLTLRLLSSVAPTGLVGEALLVIIGGVTGGLCYGALAALLRVEEVSLVVQSFADWTRGAMADLEIGGPRVSLVVQSFADWTRRRGQTVRHVKGDPADEDIRGLARRNRVGSTRGLTAHARTQAPPARPIADPVDAHRYDEAYFLRACEGYEEYVATEGKHLSRRLHQAFEAAEIAPGMTVLDVGCGRGEILRRCLEMNVRTYGVDFAPVAVHMARELALGGAGLYQADAKTLPFPSSMFDRVLMFDLVEHLHPWELDRALQDARRVLGPGGRLIVHTAPNAWYDRFAYPIVRFVRRFDRTLPGQGLRYPKDPRSIIPDNLDVHVNEQSVLSLRRSLTRAGFRARVWLDTPPQHRTEGFVFRLTRHILFRWIPFRWFFEREVFAVAEGAR